MRELRCVCIVVCLFALMPLAFAKSLSKVEKSIATRWIDTPIKKLSGDNSVTYTKSYERFVTVGQKRFSIATASYSHLIEKKASESVSEIVEGMKVGYGPDTKWKTTSVFNGVSMVGDWKAASRTVHLLLFRPAENQFVVFSALTKSRYDQVLTEEVKYLKDRIMRFHNKKKFSFFSLILATSWAQSFTNPFGAFDPGGEDTLHTQELASDIRDLNTTLQEMQVESQNWQVESGFWLDESGLWRHESGAWRDESGAWRDQTNNFIDESASWRVEFDNMIDESGNWRGESDQWQAQLQAMSDKWGIEVDQLQSMFQDESGAWRQFLANESGSWQQLIASESQEWRSLVEKVLDPVHMGQLAFATAAGAALGTLAVNLLVDGAILLGKELLNLITDAEGKRNRWNKFAEARKNYEDHQQSILDLENSLDTFLSSYAAISDFEGEGDVLQALKSKVTRLKYEKRELDRKYDEEECEPCREKLHNEANALEETLKSKYLPILEFVEKKGIRKLELNDAYFCEQLKKLKDKLTEAELQLNDFRMAMINGEGVWFENELAKMEQRQEDIERMNTQQNKYAGIHEKTPWKAEATKFSEKLITRIEKDAKKVTEKNMADWIVRCVDGESEVGKIIREEAFFTFERKKRCEKAFELVYGEMNKDAAKTHEKLVEESKNLFKENYLEARKIQFRRSHNNELEYINNMMLWFEDLKAQVYCYGKMDENPKHYMPLCEERYPRLVSLRRSKLKAKEKWNEMCASKMDNFLDRLFAPVVSEKEEMEAYLKDKS